MCRSQSQGARLDGVMTTVVAGAFDDVVERVKVALHSQGFVLLSEIDSRPLPHGRAWAHGPRHLVLGACNPTPAPGTAG